jgi:hypothetical protein
VLRKYRVSAGKENTILFDYTRAICYRPTMAKEKKEQESKSTEAAKVAAAPPPAPKISTKPAKIPKLQKKHKTRLPRRQKKAAQKAALAAQSSR